MNAYIVVSGQYSDWQIDGVYLDKEKAEKFRDMRNSYQPFNESYIIEKPIKEDLELSELEVFEYTFAIENDTLVLQRQIVETEYYPEPPYVMGDSVIVKLRENNQDKAFKIACDTLAKQRAEEEGL